jgi:hypothetical protein
MVNFLKTSGYDSFLEEMHGNGSPRDASTEKQYSSLWGI